MRSTVLLNENGDTTIAWDESNDEKMIELIQKKMNEGMTFFIIKQKFFNLIPVKVRLKNTDDVLENRQVIVKDEDFNEVITNGTAVPYKRNATDIETVAVATTAKEAAQNHTVAVTQRKGG